MNEDIFLIVTGTVEKIRSEDDVYNVISAGGLIGEYSCIHDRPATSTYRTVSYVRALRLTATSYMEFIKKNKLDTKIRRLLENREVLEKTWLFGESISPSVQNRIAEAMVLQEYDNGGVVIENLPSTSIFIVDSGKIERIGGGKVVNTLGPRSFFGEEQILFGKAQEFDYRTAEPCRIYEVPGNEITGIPIVMWKLLETFELLSAA